MVANYITQVIYGGILTLQNVGTEVNYCGIFIPLGPSGQNSNLNLNVQFFNTTANQTSVVALDSCIPAQESKNAVTLYDY